MFLTEKYIYISQLKILNVYKCHTCKVPLMCLISQFRPDTPGVIQIKEYLDMFSSVLLGYKNNTSFLKTRKIILPSRMNTKRANIILCRGCVIYKIVRR